MDTTSTISQLPIESLDFYSLYPNINNIVIPILEDENMGITLEELNQSRKQLKEQKMIIPEIYEKNFFKIGLRVA
jgi:hypothetical protein